MIELKGILICFPLQILESSQVISLPRKKISAKYVDVDILKVNNFDPYLVLDFFRFRRKKYNQIVSSFILMKKN